MLFLMPKYKITAEQMREYISYDPDTGHLTAIKARGRASAGKVLGCKAGNYLTVRIFGYAYKAHRIAWLLHTGEWPVVGMDHRNGIGTDNRICNLREATTQENSQNALTNPGKTSKYIGVCWHKKTQKWQVRIKVKRRHIHIGIFKNEEDAY